MIIHSHLASFTEVTSYFNTHLFSHVDNQMSAGGIFDLLYKCPTDNRDDEDKREADDIAALATREGAILQTILTTETFLHHQEVTNLMPIVGDNGRRLDR